MGPRLFEPIIVRDLGHMPWPRAGLDDEILASSLQQQMWARWNCCDAVRKRNMPLELGRDRVPTNACQRALSNERSELPPEYVYILLAVDGLFQAFESSSRPR